MKYLLSRDLINLSIKRSKKIKKSPPAAVVTKDTERERKGEKIESEGAAD